MTAWMVTAPVCRGRVVRKVSGFRRRAAAPSKKRYPSPSRVNNPECTAMGQPRISRWLGDFSPHRAASSARTDDSEIVYRIRRVLVSDRLHLDETVYAANQNVLPHSHSRAILILPLEGRVLHSVGGTVRIFVPGE